MFFFYRDFKGVYLIEFGKYILLKVEVLVKEFENFVVEINDMVNKKKERLRVGFVLGIL